MSLASCTSSFAGQRLAGAAPAARQQAAAPRRHQHLLVQAAGGQQKDGMAKGRRGRPRIAPGSWGRGRRRGRGARPASTPPLPAPHPAGSSLEERIAAGEFTDAGSTKERLTRPLRRILAKDPIGPGAQQRWLAARSCVHAHAAAAGMMQSE